MIENQDHAWNHQERFGQSELILTWERNLRLEKVNRFITNETDRPTGKPRQFETRYKLITAHQLLHFADGAPPCFQSLLFFALNDPNLASVTLHHHARIEANKRKPSRDIVLFGRLEKEAITAAVQFLEGRNWRF